jgi:hypothetical protein
MGASSLKPCPTGFGAIARKRFSDLNRMRCTFLATRGVRRSIQVEVLVPKTFIDCPGKHFISD